VEIAQNYRQLVEGTLVGEDDVNPRRGALWNTAGAGGRATPANPSDSRHLLGLGHVLLRRGKQNIGAGAFWAVADRIVDKSRLCQQDPSPLPCPLCAGALLVMAKVFERALIAERTKAGLRAARNRGRVGGNPGLRAGDPEAIRKVRAGRDAAHLAGVLARLDAWLPTVRRMRPSQPWGDVVRVLNRSIESTWTVERLRRTVRRLASEGIVEAKLLDRAPRQAGDDRLIRLVAGIAAAAPGRTLQQIAAQLEAMRERTPRGGTRWHPSSVKHLLARAERLGLAGIPPAQVDPEIWR
jgi:hypothetical protein